MHMGSFTRYVTPVIGREGTLICYVIVQFICRAMPGSAMRGGGRVSKAVDFALRKR